MSKCAVLDRYGLIMNSISWTAYFSVTMTVTNIMSLEDDVNCNYDYAPRRRYKIVTMTVTMTCGSYDLVLVDSANYHLLLWLGLNDIHDMIMSLCAYMIGCFGEWRKYVVMWISTWDRIFYVLKERCYLCEYEWYLF